MTRGVSWCIPRKCDHLYEATRPSLVLNLCQRTRPCLQAAAAPSSLLPGSLLGGLAADDLLHYGLLSQSGCASVQQHLAEEPAPKQVLLDKLFTSLAALQDAKKAADAAEQARAATPSPPSEACGPAMRQSPFEAALLSQLSQLDLGAEAPRWVPQAVGPRSHSVSPHWPVAMALQQVL